MTARTPAEVTAPSLTDIDLDAAEKAYRQDGYVAVPGLVTPDEVETLRAEAVAIARGARGPVIGADGAKDHDRNADHDAIMREVLAIHFPHKASPAMRDMLSQPNIVAVLNRLIGPNVKAMQSMLFVKSAGKPGQAWHQDEYYIPTRDRSLCGVWIALDDATIENGCLWMQPGSHRRGVIYPTLVHEDPRFDVSEEARDFPYDPEGGVPAEIAAGGALFFNGYVLHRSLPNKASSGFRRALVNHYMSAESLLPWSIGFPPTPRTDFRDVVLVSGDDPYANKGIEDLVFPFVRPEDPVRAQEIFAQVVRKAEGHAARAEHK